MTHKLFDEAIGAMPPSTVDVEAIRRRQRHRSSIRRLTAMTAGVAVVAAATVSIGAATAGTRAHTGPPSAAGTDAPAGSVPTASPDSAVTPGGAGDTFRLVANTTQSAKITGERLRDALVRA